jgi:hypothetical protein
MVSVSGNTLSTITAHRSSHNTVMNVELRLQAQRSNSHASRGGYPDKLKPWLTFQSDFSQCLALFSKNRSSHNSHAVL